MQQEESTHRSFLSLPLSFFSPLRFLSCRGIILCLLTPLQPQTCQHELTGWKRKKNIYPQHFCDLLHCHCGCDLSGPVTYFSSNLSVTQMMPSQQRCKFVVSVRCASSQERGRRGKQAKMLPPHAPLAPQHPSGKLQRFGRGQTPEGESRELRGGGRIAAPPALRIPARGQIRGKR